MNSELLALAKKGYADRDESHGHKHWLRVMNNVILIAFGENIVFPVNIILDIAQDVAVLHDVLDHKYMRDVQSQAAMQLEIFDYFEKKYGNAWARCALYTIHNMSWSKASKVDVDDESFYPTLFYLVRDADWIEAIDIKRCIAYCEATKKKVPQDVLGHVKKKLMHIKSVLHYPTSETLAEKKHEKMMKWYYHSLKNDFVMVYNSREFSAKVMSKKELEAHTRKEGDTIVPFVAE
jgi:hypothetical protein